MRIRSIKPEFWRSDDIDALSIPDRLLFIGLWSYVDDSGIGVDRESSITADLFAGDLAREPHETSVRVHGGLMRLAAAGLITRYTAASKRWLHITNWNKHKKINRPTESRRPLPTSADAEIHESRSDDSVKAHADSPFGTGEQGNRGTGETTAPDEPAGEVDSAQTELIPGPPEPVGTTAQRIAKAFAGRHAPCNFHAVMGVAKKSLTAGHTPDAVLAALETVAESPRPITADTVRAALRGQFAPKNQTVTDRAVAAADAAWDDYEARHGGTVHQLNVRTGGA